MTNKDIAFLFIPSNWLEGTQTFTRHQKGCYIDLMMAQFAQDPLSLDDIKTVLGEKDFAEQWESKLKKKFIEENGMYHNARLRFEKDKRAKFTGSRRNNAKGAATDDTKQKHMHEHMSNGNNNGIVSSIENVNGIKLPFQTDFFASAWALWLQYRKEIGKNYKSITGHQAQLNKLSKYTEEIAAAMVMQSIEQNWQGIFELKQNGKQHTRQTTEQRIGEYNQLFEQKFGRN